MNKVIGIFTVIIAVLTIAVIYLCYQIPGTDKTVLWCALIPLVGIRFIRAILLIADGKSLKKAFLSVAIIIALSSTMTSCSDAKAEGNTVLSKGDKSMHKVKMKNIYNSEMAIRIVDTMFHKGDILPGDSGHKWQIVAE